MLNLFEHFDQATHDLWQSQRQAGLQIPTVVIHDDGFLPAGIDSFVRFFGHFDTNRPPLYFDKVPVPPYWRITGDLNDGAVYHLSQQRAKIVYWHPENQQRTVKEVQWLGTSGGIIWIDHYNQFGYRFAQTIYDHNQATLRQYFDADGHKFMVEHLLPGNLVLNYQHQKYFFNDKVDLIRFFLRLRGYHLDHIFYNTLNESYRVEQATAGNGQDTLFWHEPVNADLPGNMKYLMYHPTRSKHIVFQRYQDWQNWQGRLTSDQVDFHYLGMIFPNKRQNQGRARALIATNSDQLEQIVPLVRALPQVHFNVMALTAMSPRLMALQDYHNVNLYPNVTNAQAHCLWRTADFYLDINYGDEILSADREAFEQNMLILGFNSTLHNPQLADPDNVFPKEEVNSLANRLCLALVDSSRFKRLIKAQREYAGVASVADYREMFKRLTI